MTLKKQRGESEEAFSLRVHAAHALKVEQRRNRPESKEQRLRRLAREQLIFGDTPDREDIEVDDTCRITPKPISGDVWVQVWVRVRGHIDTGSTECVEERE